MVNDDEIILYWDSSAVIAVLFEDKHSEKALHWIRMPGDHLISSLGLAEVYAVLNRIQRQLGIVPDLVRKGHEKMLNGPWERLNFLPDWKLFVPLSEKWSLRGADLWHLAMVKTLAESFPEVKLLTFDQRLYESSKGEGFSVSQVTVP